MKIHVYVCLTPLTQQQMRGCCLGTKLENATQGDREQYRYRNLNLVCDTFSTVVK